MAAERDWSSLPSDMLALVLERLGWSSHPRLRADVPALALHRVALLSSVDHPASTQLRGCHRPNQHQKASSSNDATRIFCSNEKRLTLFSPFSISQIDLLTSVAYELPCTPHYSYDFIVYDDGSRRVYCVNTTLALQLTRSTERSSTWKQGHS
uniref:Uncharacterized protein n=1 Tax=Oryza meridionalis TaxID=40149 RepID=A0A0E0ERV3_9ORYZ